jgi:hypothetical protein
MCQKSIESSGISNIRSPLLVLDKSRLNEIDKIISEETFREQCIYEFMYNTMVNARTLRSKAINDDRVAVASNIIDYVSRWDLVRYDSDKDTITKLHSQSSEIIEDLSWQAYEDIY